MPPKKLSHSLSWALRHGAPELGLSMSTDGYVPVEDLLQSSPRFRGCTIQDIEQVVKTNDKQRFHLKTDERDGRLYIRANQGHSIPWVDLQLKPIVPEVAIHGTYYDAWKSIEKLGLSRMTRQHVHLAQGLPGEVISGMRKSSQVFIYVNVEKAIEDGIVFYESENGVVLTNGIDGVIPTKYFSRVVDRDGTVLLEQQP